MIRTRLTAVLLTSLLAFASMQAAAFQGVSNAPMAVTGTEGIVAVSFLTGSGALASPRPTTPSTRDEDRTVAALKKWGAALASGRAQAGLPGLKKLKKPAQLASRLFSQLLVRQLTGRAPARHPGHGGGGGANIA